MRARADRIGAKFTCVSQPGEGTTIEVTVPDAVIEAYGTTSPADTLPRPVEPASIRDG